MSETRVVIVAQTGFPPAPARGFSFTDYQSRTPNQPLPGPNVDQELDRTNNALATVIATCEVGLNSNGTVRDGSIGVAQLDPDLVDELTGDVGEDLQPYVDEAQAAANAALASAAVAKSQANISESYAIVAQSSQALAELAATEAVAAKYDADNSRVLADSSALQAASSANSAETSAAAASNSETRAWEWAEYISGPVPESDWAGSHYSAKWWANYTQSMLTGYVPPVGGGPAVGPFLPLAGGTMVGPLNTTATGGMVARSTQDRASDVHNVKDFGAVGDGVTNDFPAIKAAVALGGTIYLPKGRYYVNGTYCVVGPNTRIYGDGPGQTVIVTGTLTGGHQDPTFGYIFISRNYDQYGAFNGTPTTPALQTDVNIAIEGIGFDMSNTLVATAPTMIARFLWASNVRIRNIRGDNYAAGITTHGWSGFGFLGCDNYSVDGFYARNVVQGIDQWAACSRAKHSNLWFEQNNGGGNGGLINWQGVGTQTGVQGISDDLQVSNATFWTNGGDAFFLDAFSAGSITQNMLLTNIKITQKSGTTSSAIIARGLANRLIVRGAVISADPGADIAPFLITGFYDQTAAVVGTNLITTTNGSSNVVVNYTCVCGIGNYLSLSNNAGAAVVGNGVSLYGRYLIVGGGPGNYTIATPTPATASGPIAATTRVQGYYGAPSNAILTDITIDGCSASNNGGALILAHGQGHTIDDIAVTQNYQGAANPGYNTIVSIDTTDSIGVPVVAACYVGSVIGAPGTGALPGGYAGTNTIAWNNAGLAPLSIAVPTQPFGTQNTTIATTQFAANLLYAYPLSLADANATLTAAQVPSRFISLTGSLTAQRVLTMPVTGSIRNWVIRNGTAQNVGIVGTAGSTVWIPALYTVEVWTDGVNILGGVTLAVSFRVGDATRNGFVITGGATPSTAIALAASGSGGIQLTSNVGFNSATPVAKPTVSGAKGSNAALASLIAALVSYGLITDTTTA